jgi:hypothetical protein
MHYKIIDGQNFNQKQKSKRRKHMADELKPDAAKPDAGKDPKDQPDTAKPEQGNVDGLVAKNKELLGEIKTLQKKISSFESASDKEKEAKLKEDGKLKELLDKKEGESQILRDRIKRAELKAAVRQYELVDDDYIDILAKTIEFDENDQPLNLEETFAALKEKKPYLFKQDAPDPKPGTHNTGASWKGGHIFTEAEVKAMDSKTLNENWPEIQRQMGEGKIK